MTPSERWNDDRLNDFYSEFRRTRDQVEKIAVMEATLKTVGEDASACRESIEKLRENLDGAARTQVTERKADRRWLIGTCLSAAALILAALGLLLAHL